MLNNKNYTIMETTLFVIIVTPKKQDIPQVVTTFTLENKPIFCSGKNFLDRARFFKTYEQAQQYNVDKVLPLLDTRIMTSYVRPCKVKLDW